MRFIRRSLAGLGVLVRLFVERLRRRPAKKNIHEASLSSPGAAPWFTWYYEALVDHARLTTQFTRTLEGLSWMTDDLDQIYKLRAQADALRQALEAVWENCVRSRGGNRLLELIALDESEKASIYTALQSLFDRAKELAVSDEARLAMAALQNEYDAIADRRGEAIRRLTVLTVRCEPDVLRQKLSSAIKEELQSLRSQKKFDWQEVNYGNMECLASEARPLLACALTLPVDATLGVELRIAQLQAEGFAEELKALDSALEEHAAEARRCLLARDGERLQQRVRNDLLQLWPASQGWERADRLALSALLDAAKRLPMYVPRNLLDLADRVLGKETHEDVEDSVVTEEPPSTESKTARQAKALSTPPAVPETESINALATSNDDGGLAGEAPRADAQAQPRRELA